jgi:hypothetical protein
MEQELCANALEDIPETHLPDVDWSHVKVVRVVLTLNVPQTGQELFANVFEDILEIHSPDAE